MKLNRTVVALGLAMMMATPVLAQEGAPADPASPTDEDVKGKLEGMSEQLQTLQSDVDKLKKFKFSGYVQVRYETAENSSDTVRVSGSPFTATPAAQERFYIRRARLKLTYDSSPLSQAVVYFDGGSDRFLRLLEAYVTLLEPWTPQHAHGLTVGQMNVPFGYELERSSSVRELPERSRAENVLFPGERDRGMKIVSAWNPKLETVVAMMNGPGVNNTDFPSTDPTRLKDFMGRARWSQGSFDAAASYYGGKQVTPLTGPDVETDKARLGLDAQFFYEAPRMGGGTLRGEFYSGHNVNPDSVTALVAPPTAANPVRLLRPGADPEHLATDFIGWYVMWVQNLGEKFQAAARVEQFDPNVDLDHDQFDRVSMGVNYFYDGFTRLTLSYDIAKTDRSLGGGTYEDPKDNLWTLQFQHKF